jgi:RecA-family ATPase
MYYICAVPNVKGQSRHHQLFSDDPAAIEDFARKFDLPGYAVYDCVASLKSDARRRALDTVAALEFIHVDVDLRMLATSRDIVLEMLLEMPLSLEIRDSGGGFHVIALLKEPVESGTDEFEHVNDLRTKLTRLLCGDPAPNHAAALLRRVGTHNSKYGDSRECCVVRAGRPVDVTEVEALVELYAEPLFELKPKTNGHAAAADGAPAGLVDVDARLAAMRFEGPGDTSIHNTQLAVTASLLRSGVTAECVVDEVLAVTQRVVADDPRAAEWSWTAERWVIERMSYDFINKYPELVELLPNPLLQSWRQREAAEHQHIKVMWSAFRSSWCVTSRKPPGADDGGTADEGAGSTGSNGGNGNSDLKDKLKNGTAPADPKKGAARFVLHTFVPFDPATLPPRDWLYGRHYQRGTVSGTIAPGGSGKTTQGMVEAIAMATCRNLLGEQPTERLRVWYHNGEDTYEELQRRVAAICMYYEIPQEELVGYFFMSTVTEVPLKVAIGYSDLKIDTPLIACISQQIETNAVDLAILDPLITLHGVPEQDNSKMDAVIRIFAGIASAQSCAVELAHHTRKQPAGANGGDYGASDMRGASATHDAMRAVRILNRMSEKDADTLGIPEQERARYFRVDKAKGNNSPAAKAVWRQFVSVDLPNGDEVGVVTAWELPGQGTPSAEMSEAQRKTDHVFMQILARYLTEGRVASDRPTGSNYAPRIFANEREAKVAQVSKASLTAAMRRLLDAKRITTDDRGSGGRNVHRLVIVTDPTLV